MRADLASAVSVREASEREVARLATELSQVSACVCWGFTGHTAHPCSLHHLWCALASIRHVGDRMPSKASQSTCVTTSLQLKDQLRTASWRVGSLEAEVKRREEAASALTAELEASQKSVATLRQEMADEQERFVREKNKRQRAEEDGKVRGVRRTQLSLRCTTKLCLYCYTQTHPETSFALVSTRTWTHAYTCTHDMHGLCGCHALSCSWRTRVRPSSKRSTVAPFSPSNSIYSRRLTP